jgi:uracil-DNA glycosylase
MHKPFAEFVEGIRSARGSSAEVPSFDPENGNERARYLLVLEAPGPGAVRSGLISFDNADHTARNLKSQLEVARIPRADIALWNVVPWYVGNEQGTTIREVSRCEVEAGIGYLKQLVNLMPSLTCIVLVGGAARRAHVALSAATSARILSCHHPSARAMNLQRGAYAENIQVFSFMRASTE